MKHTSHGGVQAWLATRPPLSALRERYPGDWEVVERGLADVVASGDAAAIERWVATFASDRHADRAQRRIRQAMALAAVRGHLLATAAGVSTGTIRFGFLNGWLAQRLLFERGLVRKPVSRLRFRLLWPLLWQRRRLMPLVQPCGIYCFYSQPLIDELVALVDGRATLEIAAGDGTLARFLTDRGAPVIATDDRSWASTIEYPADVIRQDAHAALRAHAPRVVICSWPPAGNAFEREVFRTSSVELYVAIGSARAFATGNRADYEAQSGFTIEARPDLARLVLPPEIEPAVLVFRRRPTVPGTQRSSL